MKAPKPKINPRSARIYARVLLYYAMSKANSGAKQFTITKSKASELLEVPVDRAVSVAIECAALAGYKMSLSVSGNLVVSLVEHCRSDLNSDVMRVFEYWVETSKKNPERCKLSGQRKSKILARFRDGWSVEDLMLAIDGLCSSPWHLGDNPEGKVYLDLEQITRESPRVEKFIALAERDKAVSHDNVFDLLKRRGRQ